MNSIVSKTKASIKKVTQDFLGKTPKWDPNTAKLNKIYILGERPQFLDSTPTRKKDQTNYNEPTKKRHFIKATYVAKKGKQHIGKARKVNTNMTLSKRHYYVELPC